MKFRSRFFSEKFDSESSSEVRKMFGCLKCKYDNCIFIFWRLVHCTKLRDLKLRSCVVVTLSFNAKMDLANLECNLKRSDSQIWPCKGDLSLWKHRGSGPETKLPKHLPYWLVDSNWGCCGQLTVWHGEGLWWVTPPNTQQSTSSTLELKLSVAPPVSYGWLPQGVWYVCKAWQTINT